MDKKIRSGRKRSMAIFATTASFLLFFLLSLPVYADSLNGIFQHVPENARRAVVQFRFNTDGTGIFYMANEKGAAVSVDMTYTLKDLKLTITIPLKENDETVETVIQYAELAKDKSYLIVKRTRQVKSGKQDTPNKKFTYIGK